MTSDTESPTPRRQRMSRPNAPAESIASSREPVAPTGTAPSVPPVRTRMGASAQAAGSSVETPADSAAPPARTRMGATSGTSSSAGVPASTGIQSPSGDPSANTAARTRMGGSTAATASSPSTAVPRARMGSTSLASEVVSERLHEQPVPSPQPSTTPTATARKATTVTAALSTVTGSVTAATRTVRERTTRGQIITMGVLVLIAVIFVFVARWLRTLPEVEAWLVEYPGHAMMPAATPVGIPPWLGWQHFLNMFFLVLIVRTGLQVRWEKRAPASWTPRAGSFYSPKGSTPKKVSLTQWLHQSLDVLWVVNGVVFLVLLFVTGQWLKIVPTDIDVIPNAVSAALQYFSLDWPTENGWVFYNALQMLAYFTTVFVAAPLAILTGIRFSTWWPDQNARLSRLYPIGLARAVHFPVMLYFVAFTVVHVFLVFFTGALQNLNHMYTSRNVVDWIGLAVFVASLLVIAAGWIFTGPLFTRPVASRFGTLSK